MTAQLDGFAMDELLAHDANAQLFADEQPLDDYFFDARDDENVAFLARLGVLIDEHPDRDAVDFDTLVPHRDFDGLWLADDASANAELLLRRRTHVDLNAFFYDGNRRTTVLVEDDEVEPPSSQPVAAVIGVLELGERDFDVRPIAQSDARRRAVRILGIHMKESSRDSVSIDDGRLPADRHGEPHVMSAMMIAIATIASNKINIQLMPVLCPAFSL